VQAAINAASADLPTNLPSAPTTGRNPTDTPIADHGAHLGDPAASASVRRRGHMRPRIAPEWRGVGQVFVAADSSPRCGVQVDPEAAAGVNLTLADVRTRAHRRLGEQAGGRDGSRAPPTLATNDQLFRAECTATSSLAQTPKRGGAAWEERRRWRNSVNNTRSPGGPTTSESVPIIVRQPERMTIIETRRAHQGSSFLSWLRRCRRRSTSDRLRPHPDHPGVGARRGCVLLSVFWWWSWSSTSTTVARATAIPPSRCAVDPRHVRGDVAPRGTA
jgi:hypothetical protein